MSIFGLYIYALTLCVSVRGFITTILSADICELVVCAVASILLDLSLLFVGYYPLAIYVQFPNTDSWPAMKTILFSNCCY